MAQTAAASAMACSRAIIDRDPYGAEVAGNLAAAAFFDCRKEWDAAVDELWFANVSVPRERLERRISDNAQMALTRYVLDKRLTK